MLKGYLKPLIYSIVISAAIYALIIGISGFNNIRAAFSKIGMWAILIIFGLSLVNYVARFLRWHWYIAVLGHRVPLREHLICYFSGFALTTTPGKAGEAIRYIYLKPHGVSLSNCLAALFTERFSDLVAICFLAGLAAIHFDNYQTIVVIVAVIILVVLFTIQNKTAVSFIHKKLNLLTFRKFKNLVAALIRLIHSSSSLLRSWMLMGGLLLGILSWGAEGIAFYYLLKILEIPVSIWLGIGIYAISILIGAVSFIPGGLGSTEAVMGLMLLAVGASHSEAIVATLICRVATLWFAVALGFFAMILLEFRKTRTLPTNS